MNHNTLTCPICRRHEVESVHDTENNPDFAPEARAELAAWRDERPLVSLGQGSYRREYTPERLTRFGWFCVALTVFMLIGLFVWACVGGTK